VEQPRHLVVLDHRQQPGEAVATAGLDERAEQQTVDLAPRLAPEHDAPTQRLHPAVGTTAGGRVAATVEDADHPAEVLDLFQRQRCGLLDELVVSWVVTGERQRRGHLLLADRVVGQEDPKLSHRQSRPLLARRHREGGAARTAEMAS